MSRKERRVVGWGRRAGGGMAHPALQALEGRTLLSGGYVLSPIETLTGASGKMPSVLISDASGNMYGATYWGGDLTVNSGGGAGVVYEIAAGTHTMTTLATFHGTDGSGPKSLVLDPSGDLYGVTYYGGDLTLGGGMGGGTVFKIAAGTHVLSDLVVFHGANGKNPDALVEDGFGNLWGVTYAGGDLTLGGGSGLGSLFLLAAGSRAFTKMMNFTDSVGTVPLDLVSDASGNLYGITSQGGDLSLNHGFGGGLLFKVAAGTHAYSNVVTFHGANGQSPSSLLMDATGNLFGTTFSGGDLTLNSGAGDGLVYEIAAGTSTATTLATFNGSAGVGPGCVTLDSHGNIFGTSQLGGTTNNVGYVFEILAGGHRAMELASYGRNNSTLPTHGLVVDGSGNVYGVSDAGGPAGHSMVFELPAPTHLIVTGPDAGSSPQVKVFDAASGAEKFAFYAYNQDFRGAVRVAMGDFNGDGVPDIVTATGAGGMPLVNVCDGQTGVMFAQFYAYSPDYLGGVEVAVADVTGSGHPDIITATDAGGMPLVNVFDSAGTLLLNFYAYDPNYLGGVRIASGDFAGDGKAQIVTSTAGGGQPLVNVYSWVGALLGNFWGDDASYTGGLQIAVGVFTNDGLAKVATYRDATTTAQAKLFNLATQQQFRTVAFGDGGMPLQLRLAATDVTGDGLAELVTVPLSGNAPEIEVFSSQNGTLLGKWSAYGSSVTGGLFVAAG